MDDLFILLQSKLDVNASAINIGRQLKDLESKLKEININLKIGNIDSQLQGMFKNMVKEAEKAKSKTEQVFKELKFNHKDSKQMNGLLGTLNFDDFKARIDKVKASVNELNSVKVRVGIDNKIDSAVLNYTNSLGKAVTETLAWADVTDKSGNIVDKTWKTIDTVFDDNIKKTRDMVETIERYKESMSSKLDKMELTKDIDPVKMQELRDGLNGISINADDVSNAMKNLSSAYQNTNRESQTKNQALTKESDAYKKLSFDLKEFQKVQANKINLLGNTDADTKKIAELQNRLKGLTMDTPNLKNEMKSLSNDISILGSQSEKTGSSFGLLTKYFSAYQVFSLAKRAISSLVGEVYELDKALIELKKTTSMSDTELTSFSKFAYKEASELGRSGIDFTNAVADFRRGGYDLADATKMAKNALLTLNIGDGITSVEQSSKGLISVTKALKMSAEDSIQVLDKVNNVANNTSISFDSLYEILTKSTGVLAQTGSGLDQIIAMSNAGFATLRDASVVSTGLNSISVRLLAVKEGAKEADGEIVSKLEPTLKRIAGVKIMDENGLRNMYDILADLAKVYPTLNREQQQLIASEIGGRQNIKTITALLQNWSEAEKALEFSLNSTGSAMAEQANYAQGLEFKLANLKTAWSSLAQTSLDSGFIKVVVDGTTSIVKFVDAMGGLVPIFIGVGAALLIASPAIVAFVGGIWSSVPALTAASTASAGLALSFGWLTAIGAGVAASSSGLIYLSKSAERAEEKTRKLKEELSDLQSDLNQSSSEKSQIKDLTSEYDSLRKLKEQGQLNNEQQEDFTRIQNELKKLLPEVNSYIDTQGNHILDETLLTEDLVKLKDIEIEKRKEALALASKETAIDTSGRYDKEIEKHKELTEQAENYRNIIAQGVTMWVDESGLEKFKMSLKETEDDLRDMGETHKSTLSDMENEIINIMANTSNWKALTESQENAIRKYLSALDEKELVEWHDKTIDNIDSTGEFVTELKEMPEVLDTIAKSAKNAKDGINEYGEEIKSTEDIMNDLASTLEDLEKMQDNVTKGYSYSYKEIEELRKKYPELESAIYKTAKGWGIEQGAIDDLRGSQIELSKTHMEAQFKMQQDSLDATKTRISHITKEIEAVQNLAQARSVAAGLATKRGVSTEDQSVFGAFGGTYNYEDYKNKKVAEIQKTLSSKVTKDTILGIINNQGSGSNVLTEQDYAALKKDQMDIVSYGKDIEALEKLKIDVARKYDEVTSGGLSGGKASGGSKSGVSSSSKTDKSQLPKYITQGYDDISKEILAKSDKLEREIEQANAKILNAQLLGNTEEELALQTQLEGMYDKRIELEKEKSIALIGLRKRVSTELSKKNFDVLKGINLETITEKQLSDVNRKLDAQIDKANKAKNDKLANSYKVQQDMINEHVKAILDANNNINSISLNVRRLENDLIEKSIELLERKYEIESAISSQKTKDLEYEQMLYEQDSEEYINIERQKLDVIYGERQKAEDMYNNLRERGYDSESDIVKKYHDLWYDYNVKIRQMQMETAKRNKDNELKNLKEKQAHTEQLISMTMDMLRSQYQEERELIEKNSKAKQDALNKELEGYRNIINERKKALQDEVKKEDYQTQLDQYNKELSDMKSQAALLGKDETAVVEYEKLLEDIAKKESELKKHQRDYNLGLQQESLDKELSQYEDKIKSEIDKLEEQKKDELSVIDRTLKNEVRLREEAIRLIERKNKNLFNQLNKWAEENGTKTKEEIEKAWNGAYDAISEYNNGQLDVLDTLTLIAEKIKEVENSSWTDWSYDSVDNKGSAPVNRPSSTPSSGNNSNSDSKPDSGLSQKGKEQLNQQKYLHQQMLIAMETNNEGLKKWVREQRKKWGLKPDTGAVVKQFHTGINAGRIDGLKADEVVVKALNDEWFVTNKQMENLKKNLNNLSGGRGMGDIEISIDALMKDVKIDKSVNENELAKKLSDGVFKQVKETFKIYGLLK